MLNISGIHQGFVLDHIKAGESMTIYNDLHLANLGCDCTVAMIMNAKSNKMGRKDIIKIDADIPVDLDVIGYVDPDATINVIRNGVLAEKKSLSLPQTLTNVLRCKNPRCITSCEQELPHVFRLTDEKTKQYRCIYCETKANE